MVVHGAYFDAVMGMVIIVNCILIGVEVQLELNGDDTRFVVWLDSICLVWFVAEALLRVVADGISSFQNPWFRFDVTLVTGGVLISWVIMPIMKATDGADDLPYLSQLLGLRILRLLRSVRAFRTMSAFSDVCKLCNGLLRSLRTMLSVILLVAVSMFGFTVLGVDVITKSEKLNANDETREIVESRFSSLLDFMITLTQFTTADSLAGIYYPMCSVEPLLGVYFVALWIVITVSLMNLVTGLIVDSAMSVGREEVEERLKINRKILQKNVPNLEAMFDEIDKDGSGSVKLQEIQAMYDAGELTFPKDVSAMTNPDHLVAMFEFLDEDKSGEVEKEEFVNGVSCLALSSMSIEAMQMLQLLRSCHQMLVDSQEIPASPSQRKSAGIML
jgi:voltage-gated sodium channel